MEGDSWCWPNQASKRYLPDGTGISPCIKELVHSLQVPDPGRDDEGSGSILGCDAVRGRTESEPRALTATVILLFLTDSPPDSLFLFFFPSFPPILSPSPYSYLLPRNHHPLCAPCSRNTRDVLFHCPPPTQREKEGWGAESLEREEMEDDGAERQTGRWGEGGMKFWGKVGRARRACKHFGFYPAQVSLLAAMKSTRSYKVACLSRPRSSAVIGACKNV